jgi:hypothetical protein
MDTTGEVRLVSLCAVTWHDGVQLHAATSDGCVYGYDDKRDAWDAMAPVPGTVAALATPATPAAAEPVSDTAQLGL